MLWDSSHHSGQRRETYLINESHKFVHGHFISASHHHPVSFLRGKWEQDYCSSSSEICQHQPKREKSFPNMDEGLIQRNKMVRRSILWVVTTNLQTWNHSNWASRWGRKEDGKKRWCWCFYRMARWQSDFLGHSNIVSDILPCKMIFCVHGMAGHGHKRLRLIT